MTPANVQKLHVPSLLAAFLRRTLLLLITVLLLVFTDLLLAMNLVFNGPSPSARNTLTMTLLEPSGTKWIPGLFIGDDAVNQILAMGREESTDSETDVSQIIIQRQEPGSGSEWEGHPDGIRIEEYRGKTYTAHIMLIQDPSRVYLATSSPAFSLSVPGARLNRQIAAENACAGINGGAFNDDSTSNSYVGAIPAGLTISHGQVVSDTLYNYRPKVPGFCGFNEDDVLVVSASMTAAEAKEQRIRDGCTFGPVLVVNGQPVQESYSAVSGLNPRTAVGQRADGTVIFVCADGRQAGSMGANLKDMIDILMEYGAVNACNMDGGSSTIMMYRDEEGLYGTPGEITAVSSYSVQQSEPRRMPDFWMVAPKDK